LKKWRIDSSQAPVLGGGALDKRQNTEWHLEQNTQKEAIERSRINYVKNNSNLDSKGSKSVQAKAHRLLFRHGEFHRQLKIQEIK